AVGRAVAAPDCAGAARPGWSSQEVWTWRQICAGQPADLEKGYPGSSAARVLSPDFLTALLFDPQLKALIPHTGIAIAGGEVPGALGLGNAAPGFELSLRHMRFDADVDLHGLATADDVSFAGSRFLGSLDLEGASLGANLGLEDAIVAGDL